MILSEKRVPKANILVSDEKKGEGWSEIRLVLSMQFVSTWGL